jgi:hypothetical protein
MFLAMFLAGRTLIIVNISLAFDSVEGLRIEIGELTKLVFDPGGSSQLLGVIFRAKNSHLEHSIPKRC